MDDIAFKSVKNGFESYLKSIFDYIDKLENENKRLKNQLYNPQKPVFIDKIGEIRGEIEVLLSKVDELEKSNKLSIKNRNNRHEERPINWK